MITVKITVKCDCCGKQKSYKSLNSAIKDGWLQSPGLEQPETKEFCSTKCLDKNNVYWRLR